MAPSADVVAFWQSLLTGVDYTVGITGTWDRLTEAATQEWQSAAGLEPTGRLDAPTWATAGEALAFLAADAPEAREAIVEGSRGPLVRLAQRRLVARGYRVQIDGVFSPAMVRAVRSFREAVGLDPSGDVDRAAWAALG